METADLEPQEPTRAPPTVPSADLYLKDSYRKNVMVDTISKLRLDYQHSDFTIVCGDQSFRAHKTVVCPQSQYFTKALNGLWLEAQPNTIHLPDHPLAVRMMLEFLYRSDYTFYMEYNFPSSDLAEGISPPEDAIDRLTCCELSLHLRVHLLANRLLIESLAYASLEKLWQTLHRASFFTVFPRLIRETYVTTTAHHQRVRQKVVSFAVEVLRGNVQRHDLGHKFPEYILDEIPDFARDLMKQCIDYFLKRQKTRDCLRYERRF
ncbi:hypothetical protein ABOM_004521 [Aspergillus bombycis]|uniref:BTB domain-containing protein n=1 Tax=Aspergillus bombycis TaxID=109264 RepID=A0A1F8A434_9EURO|nr:hypothetical protein ABOM_004521 [Aspergillus bombycis]OGM46500.1 hypothetical protein ABOM_004521 [Aspergillus bombycis]